MSIMTPKAPKGFDMHQFATRGGESASTYSMLSQFFPELLNQARGAPGAFDAQEQQAKDFFSQQLAPSIAARYSGNASTGGIGGISNSSGMQNSLTAGARGLTNDLYAKRQEMMQNSMRNVLSLGDLLLQNPDIENYYSQKKKGPSWWEQALGIGLPIAGAVAGGFIPGGGIAGAKLGATVGSSIGKSFLS